MTLGTLKLVRFWAPPIIIIIFSAAAAQALGFGEISVPTTAKDLAFNVPIAVMAVAYYLSPLRSWANHGNHKKVTTNIRARILEIANIEDTDVLPQPAIMNVFWRQVDADESLKKRSEDIMFNGAIWTTLADIVALGAIFAGGFAITWVLGLLDSLSIAVGFLLLVGGAWLALIVATAKHVTKSNKQLDYIAHYRKSEVAADLAAVMND